MRIHRSAVELVIQAPAKLNLFFEVLAKRNDGYHEIETLMCPIDLYDTLCFEEISGDESGVRVSVRFGGRRPGWSRVSQCSRKGPTISWCGRSSWCGGAPGFAAARGCCW